MATLEIVNGTDRNRFFRLEGGEVLGRDTESDIFIADLGVSRAHLRFGCEGGQFYVLDLASRNGTWVNQERVKRYYLNDRDTIRVGAIDIRFRDVDVGSLQQQFLIDRRDSGQLRILAAWRDDEGPFLRQKWRLSEEATDPKARADCEAALAKALQDEAEQEALEEQRCMSNEEIRRWIQRKRA